MKLVAERLRPFIQEKKVRIICRVPRAIESSEILAQELKLGPIITSKFVKSAHGNMLRPVVEVTIVIAGKTIKEQFTLADRHHLKYAILIGQNILKHGFLIDPSKEA